MSTAKRQQAEFESHLWNPGNSNDLDYTLTFDVKREPFLAFGSALQEHQEFRRASESFGWALVSLFMQIEQSAIQLCIHARSMETNPAAHQDWDMHILEEARHFGALQRYYHSRWRKPPARCQQFEAWLAATITRAKTTDALVPQLEIVEHIATGCATLLHAHACDPLLVRISSFILADEQFHLGDTPQPVSLDGELGNGVVVYLNDLFADFSDGVRREFAKLFASYSVEWLSATELNSLNLSGSENLADARERLQKSSGLAAANAHEYLARLQSDSTAMPPAGLAVEWLVAGLRGRGKELVSRRRWLNPLEV